MNCWCDRPRRRWARRADRTPVLLAVDEAHNVFPATTDDPLRAATTDLGTLIAGEGPKFGLHLFVATQRPGKVHPNVVSQCDNLVLMRMNGATDVDEIATSRGLSRRVAPPENIAAMVLLLFDRFERRE